MTVNSQPKGFTLIELLIVIAIIAILSAILIFILNPAESLKRARDSQRMADLNTLNLTTALYLTREKNPDLDGDGSRGTCATHVFIGRGTTPDITDTLVSERILKQDVNPLLEGDTNNTTLGGSGWVPINFLLFLQSSEIPRLPLDPAYSVADPAQLTTDDRLYLYGCNNSTLKWEFNANLESKQFSQGGSQDRESTDGGDETNLLEVGTDLTILPGWGVKEFVSLTANGKIGTIYLISSDTLTLAWATLNNPTGCSASNTVPGGEPAWNGSKSIAGGSQTVSTPSPVSCTSGSPCQYKLECGDGVTSSFSSVNIVVENPITLTLNVSGTDNDAYQRSDTTTRLDGEVRLEESSEWGGIRFTGANAIIGKRIVSAVITVCLKGDTNLDDNWFLDVNPTSPIFSSSNNNISSRARSPSSITWVQNPGEVCVSRDMTVLIQQSVANGYVANGIITFILDHRSSQRVRIEGVGSGTPAQLVVQYATP